MNRSVLIAGAAIVALVLWMLSGQLGSQDRLLDDAQAEQQSASGKTAMKVQTRRQSATQITRAVIVQGQVEPLKMIQLRAETSGTVQSIPVNKGQRVAQSDVIARLSAENRQANLTVARANKLQAENEYDAARKLQKRGLQSSTALDTAGAKLEAARAQLQAAQLEINHTTIRAPFNALIEDVVVENGDFLGRGEHIATLVDDSQLLITGSVPQKDILDVITGSPATARLITGDSVSGTVKYISSMADSATRSFKVEVLVDEPPQRTVSGVSAEINIPVETVKAHLISPAILALDSDGALGVKAVNESNEVIFYAIEVVKTESDGAWVTGIPDNVNLITLGQGFVNSGETVEPVPEPSDT